MVLITYLERGREGGRGIIWGNMERGRGGQGGRYLTKICKTDANFEHAEYIESKTTHRRCCVSSNTCHRVS